MQPNGMIFWDWNGTLLDDVALCVDALNRLLAGFGYPQRYDHERYRAIFGFPIEEYYVRAGFDFTKHSFKKLAEKSGGVFLGRCADAILSDRPNCYHIFVYADDLFREQRSGKEYGNLSLAEMDKEDKARQRYYNYYTGRTWGNPLNYDLMLNTSKIGIHEAAEVILDYIEKVQK